MRVLFVGGTGIISSACARATLDRGIELHLLHRGIEPDALLRQPRALGGDRRILRRGARRRGGAEPLQPRVEISQPRLQIGELVAQVVAQRREALRQIARRRTARRCS